MAQACKPLCRRAGVWTSICALAYGRMRCLSRHWFLHQLLFCLGFLLHLRFRHGCFITKLSAVDNKFPGSLVIKRKIVPLARRTFDVSAHVGGNIPQWIVYFRTTLFSISHNMRNCGLLFKDVTEDEKINLLVHIYLDSEAEPRGADRGHAPPPPHNTTYFLPKIYIKIYNKDSYHIHLLAM